ncbi:uncharacterized protein LOC129612525 [Condylostylus longicornis]|uniref:uncharacterized protein LOC129612525 n=1 Tax=Condylostylus longicornis TaxID=2530218 RepID=UPI00244E4385|nr:uncharacterized protein LOC129612525 [Condylostylus longicornis]
MSENHPSTSKNIQSEDENSDIEIPPTLDITSEDFNPEEALYSNILKPKKISFKQYSNVAQFESALTRVGILEVGKKQKPTKQNETKQGESSVSETQTKSKNSGAETSMRRFEEHQMPITGRKLQTRHQRNLIKKMEDYKSGPFSILYDSWKSQKKIIVYVRKQHGVRGYILGYLLGFDKHINLLLQNCYEIWKRRKFDFSSNNATLGTPTNCSKRLKKLGIKIPENEIKSLNRKYVVVKRKIDQILVRGEQICLIRFANANDEEKLNKSFSNFATTGSLINLGLICHLPSSYGLGVIKKNEVAQLFFITSFNFQCTSTQNLKLLTKLWYLHDSYLSYIEEMPQESLHYKLRATAIAARRCCDMKEAFLMLNMEVKRVGLKINENKTKFLKMSRNARRRQPQDILIQDYLFQGVESFKYLGVVLSNDNSIKTCIQDRIKAAEENHLRIFERKILRKIFGAIRLENGEYRRRNKNEINDLIKNEDIIRFSKSQRLRWTGHVARMNENLPQYRILQSRPTFNRNRGRPRT